MLQLIACCDCRQQAQWREAYRRLVVPSEGGRKLVQRTGEQRVANADVWDWARAGAWKSTRARVASILSLCEELKIASRNIFSAAGAKLPLGYPFVGAAPGKNNNKGTKKQKPHQREAHFLCIGERLI